jgi:hypothetical protein
MRSCARQADRARVRRDQPRGHLRAALLRDRGAPEGELDIPVFHDDQHGTAVVVMAALLNAVKLTGRRLEDLNVLIIGLGAAGIAVTKILLAAGVRHIIGADSRGALHVQREDYLDGSMNPSSAGSRRSPTRSAARRAGGRDRRRRPADRRLRRPRAAGEALARMNATRWCSRWPTPTPRSTPRRRRPTCGSWRPAARTTPTRSTTCSASRASSAARWTCARRRSPRR